MNSHPRHDRASLVAIILSALCAVHCLAFPILLALAPAVKSVLTMNEAVEWGFIAAMAGVSLYALYHGYRRHHGRRYPFLLLAVGLGVLIGMHVLHVHEEVVVLSGHVAGGLLIASAQYANIKLTRDRPCDRCIA